MAHEYQQDGETAQTLHRGEATIVVTELEVLRSKSR
jgi:hypothetical protein